jgi:hypothetical protein
MLKPRHDKISRMNMWVGSIHVYNVGIKYKLHESKCPIFVYWRHKFTLCDFDHGYIQTQRSHKNQEYKF